MAEEHGTVGSFQLDALNASWQDATQTIDHYRGLLASGAAPRRFTSLDEYIDTVPVLTKQMVQQGGVSRKWPKPDMFRITGGSTSQPIQMPAYKSEFAFTKLDPWLGRSWLGINPNDRVFLFWGHAHLLGSGWRGKLNAGIRIAKDWIQGYERVSCYDLSEERLREVGALLLTTNARFVLGYSHALDALARANQDRVAAFRQKRFLGIIGAAEAMPADDSVNVIETTFGAKLTMEYGSVETNLVAHSAPDRLYHVFWDKYLLEYHHQAPNSDGCEVILTSLYPRCTPLFRYCIGDRFKLGSGKRQGRSVLSFSSVLGRSNLYVQIPNGTQLHSETVSHIVRDCSEVAAYQFVCSERKLFLDVIPKTSWTGQHETAIRRKAELIDPQLGAALTIRAVSKLRKTVAGKLPMVVHLSKDTTHDHHPQR
jgi:phenylacetate-coenzyme A ligase PaaK-like adenylate-forming protein